MLDIDVLTELARPRSVGQLARSMFRTIAHCEESDSLVPRLQLGGLALRETEELIHSRERFDGFFAWGSGGPEGQMKRIRPPPPGHVAGGPGDAIVLRGLRARDPVSGSGESREDVFEIGAPQVMNTRVDGPNQAMLDSSR